MDRADCLHADQHVDPAFTAASLSDARLCSIGHTFVNQVSGKLRPHESMNGDNLMVRLTVFIALLVSLSACGGDATPTSPGRTSPSTFTLSGTVIGYDGPLSGGSVTIMDGVHAGQTRETDGAGKYIFTDLTPSAFTLQSAAIYEYLPQNVAVNLTTANQSVDFHLVDH